MDYKVLYRKYRPTTFDELVGQDHIKTILKNSIVNDKIAHAYIFTGPRGTGKTSTAKLFAKAINCENNKDGISCGECSNCINYKTSPDIIEMDAASNNSVDNIREIINNVSIAPTNSKYKIYIIDEVHMLSQGAWNAFLKTLEEPPPNVIFILATTDIQKVPITVLSRCQRFDFSRIDKELIYNNLKNICDKEEINCEEEVLHEISYLSEGCMRDALSILDQLSKISDDINMDVLKSNYGTITNDDIEELYVDILHNDIDALVEKIKSIKETGIDIKICIDKILDNFVNKAIDMKKKNLSNAGFKQLKSIITSLNELLYKINNNSNGFLLLELELISFINDSENKISNRDITQIMSKNVISSDKKIDVNNIIKDDNKNSVYNICDKFIDIRVNNSFVDASKTEKIQFGAFWKQFSEYVEENDIKELKNVVKNSLPQVASKTNVLMIASKDSIKTVANNVLYNFETTFNTKFGSKYKFIFITKAEWDKLLETFDKDKKYEIKDESEYVNLDDSSINLAHDIFGDKIGIE